MADYVDRNEILKLKETITTDDYSGNETIDVVTVDEILGVESADVVERSKIDKAIEAITKLRDSTSRMITGDVDFVNECYEQYVNCFDECLRIIKRI